MINILALSLVLGSLAAAGIWSPTPQRERVRLKEGHTVIVADHDEDGKRNTDISISSPPPPQQQPKPAEYFGKEALKEAASVLPNLVQGISLEGKAGSGRQSPGELICDAFGKCTRTIGTVLGKAKDKVSYPADEAKDKVSETVHGVKDKVLETAHEAKDKVVETTQQAKGAVDGALGNEKEEVAQKGRHLKESAKEYLDKAKDSVGTAKDTAEMARCHILNNCTEKMKMERENAEEAKEAREKTVIKGKSSANKLFDGAKYVSTMEALNPVTGIANLVGLASAYGVGVWVTFISSNVLGEVLPRQQFGVVQSKIYPVYFKAMGYSIGMALLGYILGQSKTVLSSKHQMLQAFNLLSSFLMVLVNALYFEPKASKVMLERMKMEKEEGRGRGRDHNFVVEESRGRGAAAKSRETHPASAANIAEEQVMKSRMVRLNERLKKLNTKSSLLNVVTLMALTWHLVYLAHHLSFNSSC
ncbi:hypothetical protein Gogos_008783 [Gossypium gossypioides]|uniref:TMEM205-like domain-containing protein n=1 Tax=Gossypium gossypioides TaxID=34282 RepID=A0A7J9CCR7_GOSGO|nr:hypothetical protein [Gossypium gossypioides]